MQQLLHPRRGISGNIPSDASRIASGREIPEGSWGTWRTGLICCHEILEKIKNEIINWELGIGINQDSEYKNRLLNNF